LLPWLFPLKKRQYKEQKTSGVYTEYQICSDQRKQEATQRWPRNSRNVELQTVQSGHRRQIGFWNYLNDNRGSG
jgi:hypothetical protein